MTVCVAAIGQYNGSNLVIGASDRMVTSGDVEFEQEQRKIYALTNSISILIAGDLSIQADVLHELIAEKDHRLATEPERWLTVNNIAHLFFGRLSELRRARASAAILEPLGLDFEKLTSPQVAPDLAAQLSKEILDFQIAPIAALIIGLDESGPHIYEVNNGGVTCQDWTGFSSIGAGAWHANSQLMFAGHVKTRTIAETLMLVYTAKRRAEVAPGVGEQTDMIVVGPSLGESTFVGDHVMEQLKLAYGRVRAEAERVRSDENANIAKFVEETFREAAVQPTPDAEVQGDLSRIKDISSEEPFGEETI